MEQRRLLHRVLAGDAQGRSPDRLSGNQLLPIAGQFAAWNHPAEGYPLSDAGQARWIADFVAVVRGDPNFAGAFYWSPEWYDGGLWDAFALFDANGVARPGV